MKIYKAILACLVALISLSGHAAEKIEVQALMPGLVVLLIDGDRTTLRTGEQSQGVKLISSTTKNAVLEVNGESKNYQMGTAVATHFRKRDIIIERVVSDKRGMFRGHGSINGQSVKFLIDTGATSVAMSAKQARKLGVQYRLEGKPSYVTTASGRAKAWSVKFSTVSLGKLLERNVSGVVVDGDYPQQVLLGMTFLKRMKVEKEGHLMKITRKK